MDWRLPRRPPARTLRSLGGRALAGVRRLAFWTAVVLPVLYVPPLIAGPDSPGQLAALAALVAVHVVAILVGHDHRRVTPEDEPTR